MYNSTTSRNKLNREQILEMPLKFKEEIELLKIEYDYLDTQRNFYKGHKGQPFYMQLIKFMGCTLCYIKAMQSLIDFIKETQCFTKNRSIMFNKLYKEYIELQQEYTDYCEVYNYFYKK